MFREIMESMQYYIGSDATFILLRAGAAFVILFLGLMISAFIRRSSVRFFRKIKIDEISEKIGFEDFLVQGGVRYTASSLCGLALYWFFLFVFIVAAFSALGVKASELLFIQIIAFLPNILIAVVILFFGIVVSRFLKNVVRSYLNNIQFKGANFFSIGTQVIVLIFTVSLVLEQLQIGGSILVAGFQILFGSTCLALAISFGLGGRRVARDILEKAWKK